MNLTKLTKGVALLHFGRAGSTLIATMIAQNRLYFDDAELFEKVRVGDLELPENIKSKPGLFFKHRKTKFYYQNYLVSIKPIPEEHLRASLLDMDYEQLIDALNHAGIAKFIIIKRSNYLSQIISKLLAIEWKKYHFRSNEKSEIKKITINCNEIQFGTFRGSLIDLFQKYDKYYEQMERVTPNALILNYEEDIESDPLVGYAKIRDYLKLRKNIRKYYYQNLIGLLTKK